MVWGLKLWAGLEVRLPLPRLVRARPGAKFWGNAVQPFAETRKVGLAPHLLGVEGWPARSKGQSDHWYVSVKLSRYTL
jgi:hypothetical protein